jgi:hypothetical protein
MGSLIIIDALHIPFGCSVWPSFWTVGIETEWPLSGEIDIIEAINDMNNNQVALHTVQGCAQQVLTPPAQTGHTVGTDCSVPEGCLVTESQPNSYGPGFAAAGGGVYALQMEVSGIYVWFWSVCRTLSSNYNSCQLILILLSHLFLETKCTAQYPGCDDVDPHRHFIVGTTYSCISCWGIL